MSRRDKYRQRFRRVWLAQHARMEAGFAKGLRAAYKRLAADLGEKLAETRDLAQAFDLEAWQDALDQTGRLWLARAAVAGAGLELSQVDRSTKALEVLSDGALMDIPADVLSAIDAGLEQQLTQPFWRGLALRDRQRIADELSARIEAGDDWQTILRAVDRVVQNADRAARIARTETTGALNAGHAAARDDLIREGFVAGSEWLSSGDNYVRDSHVEVNGQVVGAGELFNVGGNLAPYPGHWSLPASERIGCRCLTVASGTFAD